MTTHLHREIENLKRESLALGAMAETAVRDATCAVENRDERLARDVIGNDITLDAMNRKMYLIVQRIAHVPACQTESLIHMLSACQHLERIADHATNIAEDVIYMIDGVIVRHRTEDYLHDPPVCRQTSAHDTQAQPGTVRLL